MWLKMKESRPKIQVSKRRWIYLRTGLKGFQVVGGDERWWDVMRCELAFLVKPQGFKTYIDINKKRLKWRHKSQNTVLGESSLKVYNSFWSPFTVPLKEHPETTSWLQGMPSDRYFPEIVTWRCFGFKDITYRFRVTGRSCEMNQESEWEFAYTLVPARVSMVWLPHCCSLVSSILLG